MNKFFLARKSWFDNQQGVAILAVIVLVVLSLAVVLGLYLSKQKNIFSPKASQQQPLSAANNSVTLVADKGEYKVGENIKLSVYVRNDSEAANLYVAKLKFPTTLINFLNIDQSPGTFVSKWTQSLADPTQGTIDLVAEVSSPGYKTTSGNSLGVVLANINFLATKNGTAAFQFNTDTTEPTAIYSELTNNNLLSKTTPTSIDIGSTIIPTPTPDANLRYVQFTSPKGGETFVMGKTMPIKFALKGVNNCSISWRAEGTDVYNLASQFFPSEQSESWTENWTPQIGIMAPNTSIGIKLIAICYHSSNTSLMTKATTDVITLTLPAAPSSSPAPTCNKASADINKDSRNNLPDLSGMLTRFLKTGTDAQRADLDGNCVINSFDYGLMIQELVKSGSIKQ